MNYLYTQVEYAADNFEDPEMQMLTRDFAEVLHDLEWYDSGDTSRQQLDKSIRVFKRKWFNGPAKAREHRLTEYIDNELAKVRTLLVEMIGESDEDIESES